jgi:hypothetical protein
MDNLEQALNSGDFSAAAKQRHATPLESLDAERFQLRHHVEDSAEEASARAAEEKLLLWVLLGCQNQSAHQLALIHHQTWHPSSVMISWGRLQDLGAEVLKPMTGTFQITLCIYPGSLTTSVSLPRVSAHRMALLRLALGFEREPLSPRYSSHNGRHHASPDRRDSYGSPSGDYERRHPTERSQSQQIVNPPPSQRGRFRIMTVQMSARPRRIPVMVTHMLHELLSPIL